MEKETQEKQQEEAVKETEVQNKGRLEKLKPGREKAVRIAVAAAAVAAVAVLICVLAFRGRGSRLINAYISLGDVTFTDKAKQEDGCYVTFTAADYNCIPEALNAGGVTVRINEEIYDALALNVKYSAATVSCSVPAREAAKAGYREAEGNMNALWQGDLITEYGCVISLVW